MTAGQAAYVAFMATLTLVALLVAAGAYLLVQDVTQRLAEVIA